MADKRKTNMKNDIRTGTALSKKKQAPVKKGLLDYVPFDFFYIALILFAVAIVPMIVRFAYDIPPAPEETYMLRITRNNFDFFSYNRNIAIKYSTILLGIVFALDFFNKNFGAAHRKEKLSVFFKRPEIIAYAAFFVFAFIAALVDNSNKYGVFGINEANSILVAIPLYFFIFSPLIFIVTGKTESNIAKPAAIAVLVFFAGVILTTVFTRFKYLTFHGSNERYESIYALIGYVIVFLAVMQFADSAKKIKIVTGGLIFSAVVLGLIAVFQMLGKDIFLTDFAAKLVYGDYYQDGMQIKSNFLTSAYALFYNPNCLGLYASMAAPFFLFSSVFMPWRSPLKYVFFAIGCLSVAALIGSNSASGMIGALIASFAGVLLGVIYYAKTSRNAGPLFIGGAVTVVFAAVVILLVPGINSRISYVVNKIFISGSSFENQFLRNLRAEDNEVELVVRPGSIKIKYFYEDQLLELRYNDEPVEPYQVDEPDENGVLKAHYNLEGVGNLPVSYVDQLMSFRISGYAYNFYADPNNGGKLLYLTSMGYPMDINEEIPAIGFKGNEMFASGRGYIWSRTIPLLKKSLIKGYGVDSYVVSFPQYDIVGKTRHLGNPSMLIDKAHNGFLQYAVNTGVMSLLAILFLIGYYLTRSVKSVITKDDADRTLFALKFGLAVGVVAYSITFLSTDSTVSVSTMFWGLFGLGLAVTKFSGRTEEQQN